MMKSGANFVDENTIKRLMKAGKTAKEISVGMQIELSHIETYFKKTKKSQAKPAS